MFVYEGAKTRIFRQQERAHFLRRFEQFVAIELKKINPLKLFNEKECIHWINPKAKKTSQHLNFYAFDRVDNSELNVLLNDLYLKHKSLQARNANFSLLENFVYNMIHESLIEGQDQKNAEMLQNINKQIFAARREIEEENSDKKFDTYENFMAWHKKLEQIRKNPENVEFFKKSKHIGNFTFEIGHQFMCDFAKSVKMKKLDLVSFLDAVQYVNSLLMFCDSNKPIASYRNEPAFIRGGDWAAAPHEQIHDKMNVLIKWVVENETSGRLYPIELAAILHTELVRIQPFNDANHRTARLIASAYLITQGFPPFTISEREKSEYNAATNKAIEKHEIDDLVSIFHKKVLSNALKMDQCLDLIEKQTEKEKVK